VVFLTTRIKAIKVASRPGNQGNLGTSGHEVVFMENRKNAWENLIRTKMSGENKVCFEKSFCFQLGNGNN